MIFKDLNAAKTAIKIVIIYISIASLGIILIPWFNHSSALFSISPIYLLQDAFFLLLSSCPLFYLIYRSASQQNHHQQVAKQSELRYRSLFNNMGNGACVYRPIDGDQDFVIVDLNSKGGEIAKVNRQDYINRKVSTFPPDVTHEELLQTIKRVHTTGIAEDCPIDRYRNNLLETSRANYVYRLDSGEIVVIYNDITEKKRLEEQLKQSKEKVALQNSIITLFLTINDDAVYQHVLKLINNNFDCNYGSLGYFDDQDQVIITSLNNIQCKYYTIAVKDLVTENESTKRILDKVLETGTHFIQNEPFTSPITQTALQNGVAIPIQFQEKTIAILFLGNKTESYTGNDVDLLKDICSYIAPIINARLEAHHSARLHHEANTKLKKSESNLKEAEKLAKTGHWEYDFMNDTLLCSDEVYQICGLEAAHFIPNAKTLSSLIHPDDQRYVKRAYITAIKDKKICELPHRILLDDGTVKHVQDRCVVTYDDKGNPVSSLGTVQDITERVRAEETTKMLATAIEQAVDAVLVTDNNGIIQYVNPAFEKLSGYTKEETIGQNPRFLKSGEHSSAFYQDLWTTISSGEIWQGQLINKSKSGEILFEETTITPIRDDTKKIINYVAVRHNISREIELEEQLRQAVKMEAVGTFAGGIAHDFNNILGAMLGFTQMAMDEIPKKSQAYKDLSEVLQSGDRAADLVKQILLFGRHQNQGHVPVQIQFLIKEAIKMLRASLSASIVIEENIDVDCPSIMADPTQIYQVLINLCANSRQAMLQHGGTLSIGLSHTDFSKDDLKMPANVAPGQYIKITIEDTGSGIEEKTLSRIFDPFFTTKSIGEGTGLGLAVVHGIIKSHHGHISVKSTLQEGTKFTVLLPVDETDTKVEPIANNDTLPTGTEHILVVDDEPNILLIRERLLLKLGYQVSTFGNGLEALEAFQKEPLQYDLLLVDMAMPGMDGKEFIANIKKITPDVPAILCTGNAELLTKDQAIQYGFCDLLEKPIKPLPLAKAIRRYLNEK